MAEMFGQKDGRQDRLRQTAQWLGATPVDDFGAPIDVIPSTYSDAGMSHVCEIVSAIRSGLARGVSVEVTETHPPYIQAVQKMLSPEELKQVVFHYQVAID